MNTIVQLTLSASTHNHGFSLDEFILELNGIMEKDGIAGIASLVLNVIDEQLTLNLCRNVPDTWRPETICCEGQYELAERRGRTLRSRVGTLQLHWRRVRCRRCGKTLVVLRDFMGLAPYQRKTNELEQTVVEVVSEQSYRRSSNHLESIGVIPVPKSTAHRWVADSDCDLIDPGGDTMDLLFSDGSGYKRRPDLKNGITNRGEVRVVFGIENTGRLRPLGAWSEKTWEQIARDVQGKRPDGRAVAEMLISDGEQGMVDAMGRLCDFTQRCHWHASRDLNHTMWQDEAPLKERKESTRELAGILDVVLPKEDVEPVTADDKMALADAAEQAERKVDAFCRDLLRRGYTKAWKYVQQMKRATTVPTLGFEIRLTLVYTLSYTKKQLGSI